MPSIVDEIRNDREKGAKELSERPDRRIGQRKQTGKEAQHDLAVQRPTFGIGGE